MALNDIGCIRAEFKRSELIETLLGLGNSVNDYLYLPLPQNADLSDFFTIFCEGCRELSPLDFFVQTRLKKGRLGLGYTFTSKETEKGELRVSVIDNGENIPQAQFNDIYSLLRKYIIQNQMSITGEEIRPEY